MPNYKFRCKKCGKEWSSIQRYDAPYPKCECGGSSTKLFGTSNFSIKYPDRHVVPGSNFGGKK